MLQDFFSKNSKPNVAIFLSGSGTNAEKLLESLENPKYNTWNPSVLVTDNPNKSRASEIAKKYSLPVVELDIRVFYQERGLKTTSLATEEGRKVREEWTDSLRKLLAPYSIDFGVLAGFVPLTNITSDFPCLNVHPGDLTVEENGSRVLVGLHTIPIERAIINGFDSLRTSVIVAQTYTGVGGEMDSGPILGLSDKVKIDLKGNNLDELINIYNLRPTKRPIGGYKDLLEEVAKHNQELLKVDGDWKIFPPTVAAFAEKKYALDADEPNTLLYKDQDEWKVIKTVVFKADKADLIFK